LWEYAEKNELIPLVKRVNGIILWHRMSALGQKRTFAVQNGMSALPPKADMCGAKGNVRYGPIADIVGAAHSSPALRMPSINLVIALPVEGTYRSIHAIEIIGCNSFSRCNASCASLI